ncbi:MAG TPA: hypothetical protein PKM25_11740 [Candidatus Ozemobacteraceae bacterium]|nr:hypothetical protein [Candidatus Ozemobacteraceae bacterium]
MKKPTTSGTLLALFLAAALAPAVFAGPLVLFDEGHAQTAGNADWVINGGFSDFADVFKAAGCTLKGVKALTPDVLREAAVVVLPEPNSAYTPTEEKAIVDFVNNGGALYAIGDHMNSDRNGDGIDSVGVLNRFLPKLGLQLDQKYFNEAPATGEYRKTPLTAGVKAVGIWGGTTVKCLGPNAEGHIFVSAKNGGGAYIATSIAGPKGGRVVAMGDSSPYDDGTGNPHDQLHNGFSNPKFNHDVLARNSVKWILETRPATARTRLNALMADMKSATQGLHGTPDESLAMFAENCEQSITSLLHGDSGLRDSFRQMSTGDAAFMSIEKSLSSQESFKQLHGN